MLQAEAVTTTRRTFLAGAAGVATATAGLPAVADIHLDAGLLELGERLKLSWAHERELDVRPGYVADEEFDEACERSSAIVDRIEKIPAHTVDGLRVKVLAIQWCHGSDESLWLEPHTSTDLRLAAQVIKQLLNI